MNASSQVSRADEASAEASAKPGRGEGRKKPLPRLPKKIIPIKCSDKRIAETWTEERAKDLANFPAPVRCVLLGPPSTGKSSTIKNILIRARPRYREVYVIHPDCEHSTEWHDLEPTDIMPDIPSLDFWSRLNEGPAVKRAVVIDDLEFTAATKQRLHDLALLFRYASSHKGLSIFMGHQSCFDLPVIARKMCNVFLIWRPRARNELGLIENRVGLPNGALRALFDTVATGFHDSITVDRTQNSPAPVRLNLYQPIEIEAAPAPAALDAPESDEEGEGDGPT